ncbi:MAG: hypothetical protein BroJett040_18320 [Oligoflexia bacterium]|nr:MAG: hypothetical protein BroJett040_18320 [Oligoflexia bacterium]
MNKILLAMLMSIVSITASAREWEGNNNGRYGGCVVEGTLVTMKNGTQKPIEKIVEQDRILTNTQEDFSPLLRIRGSENIPLYRVKMSSGKAVVATEGHPFITEAGLTLVSKELKPGLVLQTIDGPEEVDSVNLVSPGKVVYNIIVASDEAISKAQRSDVEARNAGFSTVEYQRRMDPFLGLSSAQHTYYINGIASGDLVIQQSIKN